VFRRAPARVPKQQASGPIHLSPQRASFAFQKSWGRSTNVEIVLGASSAAVP
jgi:hypothetical protein